MPDDSRDYELIDRLAEEFAERFRKGERPSVQDYCARHPKIADDLRKLLPALAEVERVKDEVQALPLDEAPKLRQVGEYTILREVGRGGMGVVYEAEQVSLGRRVALKVLAGGKSGHGLERFKREARAAARLHHTNIVPVFGVGDHDGLPYYVMQFIQGLGLDAVLEEVKRLQELCGASEPPSVSANAARKDVSAAAVARSLVTGKFEPPPEAIAETQSHVLVGQASRLPGNEEQAGRLLYDKPASSTSSISLPGQSTIAGRKPTYWQSVAQIGLQVAEALDYAHKQGILHRDIKPSNLLLDLHGVVWITDFGLAKADDQENLTQTGDLVGTLRYMPPEAFEGKNDARSDVYSLGLSLYELLALRPAYDERKREQLVKQITTIDPPRLATLNRAIPRDLQTIVHKAIEKNPGHRYKSAEELASDLRRFLSDHPILARRIGPVERFGRWCKRNPTVAAVSAAFVALLLVSTAAMVGLTIEARKQAREALHEKDRADANLYLARMNLVQSDWESGNLGRVLETLDFYRTLSSQRELRGFEWHYWHKRCHRDQSSWPAHRGIVWDLEYSPDGQWLASSAYGEVKLWESGTGALQHTWAFERGDGTRVAFSPNSRRLAAIDNGRTLRIWDCATHAQVLDLASPKSGQASTDVAFSPDGQQLAVVESDGELRVLDAHTGRMVHAFTAEDMLRCVGFGSNGKHIAAGTAGGKVLVWDRTTNKQIAALHSHPAEIRSIAFNHDGSELAATGIDGTVNVWSNLPSLIGDVKTPRLAFTAHAAPISRLTFSANGKYLATAGQDRQVSIWDAGTGKLVRNIKGHANIVTGITFHPDGTSLASADADGQVKVWSLNPAPWPAVVTHSAPVHAVTCSEGGRLIASLTAPDGAYDLRVANQVIRVWESGTGRDLKTIKGQPDGINAIALSSDGSKLAVGIGRPFGTAGEVKIWNVGANDEPRVLRGFTGGVVRLVFSVDGARLFTASTRELIVWDVPSGQLMGRVQESGHGAGFSLDGKLGAIGNSDRVDVWDLVAQRSTRSLRAQMSRYGTGSAGIGLGQLAFSPVGQRLAAPDDHGAIWLWNLAGAQEPLVLNGHTGSIFGLAFSPDGRRLASASQDRLVKIWDTDSGQELLVLKDHTDGVTSVSFSSDGLKLLTSSMDKTVRIWDATPASR